MDGTTRPDRWALAWLMQVRSRLTGGSTFPRPSREVTSSPITIPTRHGQVSALVYRSLGGTPLAGDDLRRPPLHLQFHGGGLVGRAVREDEHICRYLASETGAIVLALHYHAAPQVSFPVTEQECFDALHWALDAANQYGWDRHRVTVGGGGAGAKLAINTAQQAYEKDIQLSGLIASSPLLDYTRSDRETEVEKPKHGPRLLEFIADAYFPTGSTRTLPLASPAFDLALVKKLPHTLIQVGTLDWLAEDGRSLAAQLRRVSRPHTLTEYEAPGGFTIRGDKAIMEAAISEQAHFIRSLYS